MTVRLIETKTGDEYEAVSEDEARKFIAKNHFRSYEIWNDTTMIEYGDTPTRVKRID